VLLDATFRRADDRERAMAVARRAGAEAWLVECTLPEEELRRRLELRSQGGEPFSDAGWQVFLRQQQEWEPVTEVPANRHVKLDTSGLLQDTMRQVLYQLYTSVLSTKNVE